MLWLSLENVWVFKCGPKEIKYLSLGLWSWLLDNENNPHNCQVKQSRSPIWYVFTHPGKTNSLSGVSLLVKHTLCARKRKSVLGNNRHLSRSILLALTRTLLIKDAYSNGLVEGGDRVFEYCLGHEYVSAVSSLGTGVGTFIRHIHRKNIPGCS